MRGKYKSPWLDENRDPALPLSEWAIVDLIACSMYNEIYTDQFASFLGFDDSYSCHNKLYMEESILVLLGWSRVEDRDLDERLFSAFDTGIKNVLDKQNFTDLRKEAEETYFNLKEILNTYEKTGREAQPGTPRNVDRQKSTAKA